MRKLLYSLFNLRPQETWLVMRLFFIQFFFVLGAASMFITALTVFIHSFPIFNLSKAYIFTGFLLLFVNFGYRQLDLAFNIKKLSITVLIVCIIMAVLQLICMLFFHATIVPYVLLTVYSAVYLMLSYVFWGLAALLFNIRDSKRIFTLISAGDLPAKLIAYLTLSLVVPFLGLQCMLIVSIVALVAAFILVYRLFNNNKVDILKYEHEQIHYFKKYSFKVGLGRFKSLFGSDLILSLSSIAFISFLVILIIDFTFLKEVKYRFTNNLELAYFFGLFILLVQACGIFIKLIFSSRVINRIGIIRSLLFLPLTLLMFCCFIFIVEQLNLSFNKFIYLFGIMTLMAEIGRSVIQEPIFFVLFQPLKLDLRLKGHVIAKGYMYPLAMIIVGSFLYFYLPSHTEVSFFPVAGILVLPVAIWILLVFSVKRNYVSTLQEAIRTGFFRGNELFIEGDTTKQLLLQKTESDKPVEVIHSLDLLERAGYEQMPIVMKKMLHRNEPPIVDFALNWIITHKSEDCLDILEKLSLSHPDHEVRAKCLYAIAMTDQQFTERLQTYMHAEDAAIRIAATTALLQSHHAESYNIALDHLYQLTTAGKSEKIIAAQIIGWSKKEELTSLLIHLLNDNDPEVQKNAIKSAANLTSKELVVILVEKLKAKTCLTDTRHSLIAMHEHATVNFLSLQFEENEPVIKILIRIAGSIQHESAVKFLLKCIKNHSSYNAETVNALWKLSYRAVQPDDTFFNSLIAEELKSAFILTEQLTVSEQHQENLHLRKALYWELKYKTDTILRLLSFLYDSQIVNQVILALGLKESFKTSNCMELLEVSLPANLFKDINRILEVVEMNYSLRGTKTRYKNIIDMLEGIVINAPLTYNPWTNAQAIFHVGKHNIKQIIGKLDGSSVKNNEPIVQETRMFVISQNQ